MYFSGQEPQIWPLVVRLRTLALLAHQKAFLKDGALDPFF